MFRIVLLVLISNICFAQKQYITVNQAKWYITKVEQNKIYIKTIKDQDSVITLQDNIIQKDSLLIGTYKKDSVTYTFIIKNQNGIIADMSKENQEVKQRFWKAKIKLLLAYVVIGVLVVVEIVVKR